jgi:tetraacyldisaccharide 4'-kinase
LREPRSALSRADAIVLIDSGARQTPVLTAADLATSERSPIFHASIRPRTLVRANDAGWQEYPLMLAGQRIVAVSGLADAAGFHAMLADLGATLVATFDFPDHHDYTPSDVENIISAALRADQIVTTEKDLVKLERFPLANVSLYALRLEVSMDAGDEARLFDLIAAAMRKRRESILPGEGRRAPN